MPSRSEVFFFISVLCIALLVSSVYKYISIGGSIWFIVIGIIATILSIREMVKDNNQEASNAEKASLEVEV